MARNRTFHLLLSLPWSVRRMCKKLVQRTRRAVLIVVSNVFILLVWSSMFVRTFIDVKLSPAPHPNLNFDLRPVLTS